MGISAPAAGSVQYACACVLGLVNAQFSMKSQFSYQANASSGMEMATNGSLKIHTRSNISHSCYVWSEGCAEKEGIIGGRKVERRRG